MNAAISWFARNHVAANLLMALMLFGGLVSLPNIQQKTFPDIDVNVISVGVVYLGAAPEEVEQGVCVRIEEEINGINGIKEITSSAAEGACGVSAELMDGYPVDRALSEIKNAVDSITTFPIETEKPIVSHVERKRTILQIAVSADASEKSLKIFGERIRDSISGLPNVTQVELRNARDYEISIEVSEATLRRYNLTFGDVAGAVRQSSLDLAGGSIVSDSGEILLRTNKKRQTGEAFESIIVRTLPDGSVITLADVAEVRDGFVREQLSNLYNGRPAVFVDVKRAEAEDVLEVKAAVDGLLADYTPPPGVQLVEFSDETQLLRERINLLLRNGLFGFALVFTFLVLMLDLKLAVWVSTGIATAFMGGFLLFGALGVTITMVSVFGLIIVLGLVVDDAIVIGENIDTERQHGWDGEIAANRGAFYWVDRAVDARCWYLVSSFTS